MVVTMKDEHYVRKRATDAAQGHVFQHWDTLSPTEQQELLLSLQGRVAVLLLAGGQGTRLGSSAPKGCYDVGLPSHKSLFQIQAERILKLQRLAAASNAAAAAAVDAGSSSDGGHSQATAAVAVAAAAPGGSEAVQRPLLWYIMTSAFTHAETVRFFERHAFFGLLASQVQFFQQGFLPCLTPEGKVIMETRSRVATAPDGNGGVYLALQRSGMLRHMRDHNVECLDCFSVDNLLARVCDPEFIGGCHSRQTLCGSRAVGKAHPEERVGVFARRGGALHVVEYSELEPGVACSRQEGSGRLLYNWSNICMHYFDTRWLHTVVERLASGSAPYHVAHKRIPSLGGAVAGVKLELFIFDVFPFAGSEVAVVEVNRREQFAPVKNAPGSAADSPETALAALLQLHASWIQAAGGTVQLPGVGCGILQGEALEAGTEAGMTAALPNLCMGEAGCVGGVEISPLVSYAGEGLEGLVAGRVFGPAWDDVLQGKEQH
ncbi:MAG: hypothetical protein WDW36_006355 [Sanguina aurantia]